MGTRYQVLRTGLIRSEYSEEYCRILIYMFGHDRQYLGDFNFAPPARLGGMST
jgi:hypothetical protein